MNRKGHSHHSIFCPETLLVLIELHTLFIIIFHESLSAIYLFSGFSFLFAKGLFFALLKKDPFSYADIVVSLLLLLLLVNLMPTFLLIILSVYLLIRTFMAFAHVGHHH